MYIFKNAWRNITRNKGRNILIGIIIIVIACTCSITLAIRKSANDIVTSYQEKNKVEATIGMDRQALMDSFTSEDEEKSQEDMINAFNDIKSVTLDEIKTYGDSKYVSNYYYTYDLSIDAKDLTEATDSLVKEKTETTTETNTRKFNGDRPEMPGGWQSSQKTTKTTIEKIFNEKAQDGAFTLVGYESYDSMTKFVNGDYTITSGKMFDDFNSDSVVISEELASLNNLSVDDKITFVNPKDTSLTYEATIVGIYKENTDESQDMATMFSNSANKIITNINFVQKILDADENLTATITPTFIIKDSDSVEKFSDEVSEKGLSEYYTITSNLSEIESATESVDNVKVFATTFLIITLIIGGVVLMVVNMINIRERKYEIGVLRTIGMKKDKLSLQFMIELVIIGIVSLIIGAGIGSCLSVPVSNNLLKTEIENASSKYADIGDNFGMGNPTPPSEENNDKEETKNFNKMNFGIAQVSQVDSINAVVDFKVLSELLGIGILLIILSSLFSIVTIARFSPLTILKERS